MSEVAQAKLMHWMGPLGLLINVPVALMLAISNNWEPLGKVMMFFPVINFILPWLLSILIKNALPCLHARYVSRLQFRLSFGWLGVMVGGFLLLIMAGETGDSLIYYMMSFLGIYTLFVCYVAWLGMGFVDGGEEPNLRKPLQQIRQRRQQNRKQPQSALPRQPTQAPPPQPPRPSAPAQPPLQNPERIFLPTDRPVPFKGPDDFKTAIQAMEFKPPFRNLRYEALQRDPRNPKRGPFVIRIPTGGRYFLSNWFIQVIWPDNSTQTWTEDFLVDINLEKKSHDGGFQIVGAAPSSPSQGYDSWISELSILKLEDGGAHVVSCPQHEAPHLRLEHHVTPPKGRVRFKTTSPLNGQRLLSEAMACLQSPDFNSSLRNWR